MTHQRLPMGINTGECSFSANLVMMVYKTLCGLPVVSSELAAQQDCYFSSASSGLITWHCFALFKQYLQLIKH